ncbi:MAG: MFS transporter [Rhodoplanes sp.]|uniref:MFS transporter n=1 Tax=Rhodoplanes sp. TaxID=1968906 RepID=UPI001795FB6A|nr:MFS transporter [Rhodoplanes sp.]NVO12498.1 MFS transporter [Rhodoplanes sp.]
MNATTKATDDPREAAIIRKIAYRFLPVLICGYFLNYLDRTNIGFAALTMNDEIGLSSAQFGVGAGIFFFAYCIFEVPSNIVMYRVGARLWLARIMITWGIMSAFMALVVGPFSFYAARLLLGMSEAGFFPGVAFFLSTWFPKQYRARIMAWFLLSIPLSSLLGSPVSGALLHMDGIWGLSGWQWMFIIEGTPTALVGLWALRALADSPATATWLTDDERTTILDMLAAERRDKPRKDIMAALRDPRVHVLAVIQFGFTVGSYGVGIWLPLILKQFLSEPLTIGFVSAIPYVFACLAMLAWAAHADRSGRVIGNLALACLLGAVGMAFSIVSSSPTLAMIGLTLALVGVTSARAIFWTIPGQILTGMAGAAGFAYINTIAALGGFVGPAAIGWARQVTGSFTWGLAFMGVILLATTLMVWPLHHFRRQAQAAAE